MSSPNRRAQKRDETHQRLYETAMRLFEEHGFEHVSVAQIAAEAGVTVPTFYAHFPGKEQLLMPVPTAEEIGQVLAREPEDLPLGERLRRGIFDWFAQFGDAERRELLARWRVVARTPSLRTRAAEYERATAALAIEALPPGPDGDVLRADAVIVTAYLATVTTVFLGWAESDGAHTLEELFEEAFRALGQT